MNLGEAVRTSVTEILSHKLRSTLTLVGIVLGTTSLVVMVSGIGGLAEAVQKGLSDLGYDGVMYVQAQTPAERLERKKQGFSRGLRTADALLTSGGVSMGQLDLVKPYLAQRGTIHFGRVRAKPGKPVTFATIEGKAVFAMPGFPVSALVSFELYVRPALLKMAGDTRLHRPKRWVMLQHDVPHATGRTEFQRAIVTRHASGRHSAATTGFQGSGRRLSCNQRSACPQQA